MTTTYFNSLKNYLFSSQRLKANRWLLVAFFVLAQTMVFGQTVGDYRSNGTGNWTTSSIWQYYNGTAWVTPSGTSPQGYPGEFPGTGTVTIRNTNTITLTTSITNLFTKLIIGDGTSSGVFAVGADIANFNTLDIIINPTGNINFTGQNELKLPANSGIKINAPGKINTTGPGSCTNNTAIYIGGVKFGVCKGAGNAEYTFDELNTFGGTLFSAPSSNTPVCRGNSINLTGGYSGPIPTSITYSWSIKAPDNTVTTSSTQNLSLTALQIGNYQATLTCNALYDTRPYSNSETITITVNDLPSTPTITAESSTTFCSGGSVILTSSSASGNTWSTGATTRAITVSTAGTYTVSVNNVTCTSAISAGTTVTVNPNASIASVTGTSPLCISGTATYVANTVVLSGGTGAWSSSNTAIATVSAVGLVTGVSAGTANIIYTITGGCGGIVSALQSVTISSSNTWTGTTSSSWFTATNWSCGSVPIADSDVTIPNVTRKPIVDGTSTTALANTITVSASSSLTVNSGNTLKVTDKVTNNSGTITFEDSASLVQTNNVSNSGNITYKRLASIRNTDYTYWSSPVTGYTLGGVSQNLTLSDKYYSYNSSLNDWKQESAATFMTAGIGYIIRGPEPAIRPALPPPPSIFEANFIGVPNNGDIPVSVTFTNPSNLLPSDANYGVSYLLGNPYPSAIDAETFLDINAGVLGGTIYFWTHNTALNLASNISNPAPGWTYTYSLDDYAAYNSVGGVSVGSGTSATSGGLPPNGKIAAGQGFFATSIATGSVVFNNSMRLAGTTLTDGTGVNQQFFKTRNPYTKTSKTIEKHRIWLNLTNTQGAFKQTLLGYVTDATNDYDDRFDGESFDGNEFVDFYSINQEKNLTIQGRALPFDENDEVPLGYRTTINGNFTINIDQTDGLLANQEVFIEDKLVDKIVNLKDGNYTFNTTAGTFDDRFVLRYTDKTLGIDELETNDGIIALYSNNYKTLIIRNNLEDAALNSVTLFSLTGQKIAFWDVKGREEPNIQIPIKNVPAEIYIVKIKTTQGDFSKKIIIM